MLVLLWAICPSSDGPTIWGPRQNDMGTPIINTIGNSGGGLCIVWFGLFDGFDCFGHIKFMHHQIFPCATRAPYTSVFTGTGLDTPRTRLYRVPSNERTSSLA